ncbi:MAG: type IX secretion system membrane protein PorP/SprF, partial [Chitinophagia bacterium]|nr:type IX secretion system membrane protein PorP/SprF [Chitinophagia bacterium]
MKNNTQKLAAVLVLVLITGLSQLFAQEVQFSQFNASSLYLNPALAGVENDVTFNSNFRSQWSSITTSQVTSQLSAIMPLVSGDNRKKLNGGIGIGVFNNSAGAGSIRETGFRASYAYSL